MSRIDYAKRRLFTEEGKRKFAYNDKTGKQVTCKPNGNLSIARGINLEVGLDDEEIEWLFGHRLSLADTAISAFWWMRNVDDVRGSVLTDITFNTGIETLLHFPKMLAAIGAGNWQVAHDELLDSDAARELPQRYQPLAQILLTGEP